MTSRLALGQQVCVAGSWNGQTSRSPSNAGISTRLIISTTTQHPNIFAFVLPILHEILLPQSIFIRFSLGTVVKSSKESFGASYQSFRVVDLGGGKATMYEVHRCVRERDALLHVVDQIYLPLRIGPVDKWQLDSGAAVAAVEEDC